MNASYKPAVIANYFLKRAKEEGKQITPMKMQKLVYFAHGLNLVQHRTPLIDEEFQAWRYGPVIVSLYQDLKRYRDSPIEKPLAVGPLKAGLDAATTEVLDAVWEIFGDLDAITLSELTHLSDSPWSQVVKERGGALNGITPIRNERIEAYFDNFLNTAEEVFEGEAEVAAS